MNAEPLSATLFDRSGTDWKAKSSIQIMSLTKLHKVLRTLSTGPPRIFDLVSTGGPTLQLGLGGKFGCAQFLEPIPGQGAASAWLAKSESSRTADAIEFYLGSTPTTIEPEFCLPFHEIVDIAQFFFETGRRDLNVNWTQFC